MQIINGTAKNDIFSDQLSGDGSFHVQGSGGSDKFQLGALQSSYFILNYNTSEFASGITLFFDLDADNGFVQKPGLGIDKFFGLRNLVSNNEFEIFGSPGNDFFSLNNYYDEGEFDVVSPDGRLWLIATAGSDVVNLTNFAGRIQINYNLLPLRSESPGQALGLEVDLRNGFIEKDGFAGNYGYDHLLLPRGTEGGDLTFALRSTHGNDTIYGADDSFRVEIRLGGGNDIFIGGKGHETLQYHSTGLGVGPVVEELSVDMTVGLATGNWGGIEFRHIFSNVESIWGSLTADRIAGSRHSDDLRGMNGADYLSGRGGNDTIYGGFDSDTVLGGAGSDLLYGDDDDDSISGDAGNDLLFGGSGADRLLGGQGKDTIDGGMGKDRMTGGTGADVFIFRSISESGSTAATSRPLN